MVAALFPVKNVLIPSAASVPLVSWLNEMVDPDAALICSFPPTPDADTLAIPPSVVANEFSVVSEGVPFRLIGTSVLVESPVLFCVTCTTKLPLVGGNERSAAELFSAAVESSTAFVPVTEVIPLSAC